MCSNNDVFGASGLMVTVNMLMADVFLVGSLHLLHTSSSSSLTAVFGCGGQET